MYKYAKLAYSYIFMRNFSLKLKGVQECGSLGVLTLLLQVIAYTDDE